MNVKVQSIGEQEANFLRMYSFYAEDFGRVKELAEVFSIEQHEVKNGEPDRRRLAPYYEEIRDKTLVLGNLISDTRKAEETINMARLVVNRAVEQLSKNGVVLDLELRLALSAEEIREAVRLAQEKRIKERDGHYKTDKEKKEDRRKGGR